MNANIAYGNHWDSVAMLLFSKPEDGFEDLYHDLVLRVVEEDQSEPIGKGAPDSTPDLIKPPRCQEVSSHVNTR